MRRARHASGSVVGSGPFPAPAISKAPPPMTPLRGGRATALPEHEPSEACFETKAWADRLRWPDDAMPVVDRGGWGWQVDLVFFARAILAVAEVAPVNLNQNARLLWAAKLVSDKSIQGDLITFERDGNRWSSIADNSWVFRKRHELSDICRRAGEIGPPDNPAFIYIGREGLTRLIDRARAIAEPASAETIAVASPVGAALAETSPAPIGEAHPTAFRTAAAIVDPRLPLAFDQLRRDGHVQLDQRTLARAMAGDDADPKAIDRARSWVKHPKRWPGIQELWLNGWN